MKWLITGDWQTRFSNLHECKIAHEQELKIIKEHHIKGHIDTGDLKDQYSPVDVDAIDFQFSRTKNIFELINPKNTFKLLGNHDRTGQHSDERNWFSLFRYLGGHIIESPEVILTDTIAVFGLPFTRSEKRFLKNAALLTKKAKKISKPKVLLFHHQINGARYSKLRGKPVHSKITLDRIHAEEYTRVFGGHLHLRQKLSDNALYIGSPFATDWGEIDQRKGFTIYDDKENKISFVESEVPGRFSFTYLNRNGIKRLPEGTQIKDTVVCPSLKVNYHKLIEKRIEEISKAYPDALVQVVPKFETVEGVEEVSVSVDNSETEKLRLYIKASLPRKLKRHRKRVGAYLYSIMERSLGGRIRSTDKITFEEVEATNVLSFERIKFDLRKRGCICITGKNKSGGVLASNGAGKTNFLSLPCVALEGKTFKGQQHDRWANWRTKGPSVISQNLRSSKGDVISVVRGRRPALLQLLMNGKDASAGKTQIEVQKQIEEVTGFTYDTLANSVYVDQTLSNAFILGTDKSRAELIARFQNLDKYELARSFAAVDMKKLVASESETEYEIGIIKDSIEDKKKDIEVREEEDLRKKEIVIKELEKARKRLSPLISTARRKMKIYGKEKSKLENKYDVLYKEDRDLEGQIYLLKIISPQEKVLHVSRLDNCPTCLRPITKEVHQKMHKDADKAKELRKKKIDGLSIQKKTIQRKLSKYEKKVMFLGQRMDHAEESITDAERYIDKLTSKLAAVEELQKEDAKISSVKRHIEKSQTKMHIAKKYLKDLRRQKLMVAFAVDTFSRKGFPAFLSKLVCPVLNKAAEYYSDLFLDGEIAVVFDVINDTLTPKIINPNGDKEIQGQSMGEKAWAGLISSFALREIAQRSNLLILDEPGNGLDSQGARRFGERIKRLENRFDTILITTHNENIQAALEGASQLEVVKKHKISHLTEVFKA